MEDLNEYLIDQLSNENQDLVHDQILISQQDPKEERGTDYQTVKVTSFNSDIDLKSQKEKKKARKQKPVELPRGNKAPMTSRADPGSKR